MLNRFGQYRTTVEGLGIHFLHVRSPHAGALPLIMTHGWPGSVIEFHKVIGPLTNPRVRRQRRGRVSRRSAIAARLRVFRQAGRAGLERRPHRQSLGRADARLGYDRYVAQGGDWGSVVTREMARQRPAGLAAIHLNMRFCVPHPIPTKGYPPRSNAPIDRYQRFLSDGFGYFHLQATRPQTIGYGLTDSPVGQAAWIYEKFHAWTDNDGEPENVLTRDEMLDNIMLYWLTQLRPPRRACTRERGFIGAPPVIEMPAACSNFPGEIVPSPRSWAERVYPNLIHWNELDRGGHFAAFEQPALFMQELRDSFRSLR